MNGKLEFNGNFIIGKSRTNNMSDVNKRKGHRAYVTKTINTAKTLLDENDEKHKNKLLSFKTSLGSKLSLLQDFDERILEEITESNDANCILFNLSVPEF